MSVVMAERIRIIVDTDEELKLAVRLAATAASLSVSELVCSILRRNLPREIADARKYMPKKKKETDE